MPRSSAKPTTVASRIEVGQTAPDVVVMDLDLPTVRGVDAIREIVKISPSAKILVLSVSGAESDVLEAVKNGAAGYLLEELDGRTAHRRDPARERRRRGLHALRSPAWCSRNSAAGRRRRSPA